MDKFTLEQYMKHGEVMKAFYWEGKEVQCGGGDIWTNTNKPDWDIKLKYRVKPEEKKTIGYRRYVWNDDGEYHVDTLHDSYGSSIPDDIESDKYFIRWIDTEWQFEVV